MSQHVDRLLRAQMSITMLLGAIPGGTKADPRMEKMVDLALQRAKDWSQLHGPPVWERGGSSSESGDALEIVKTIRLASTAVKRIPEITRLIETLLAELHDMVQKFAATEEPPDTDVETLPGCASCARTAGKDAGKIGGHFRPVVPAKDVTFDGRTYRGNKNAAAAGLCRNCYDASLSRVIELDLFDEDGRAMVERAEAWPPIRYCHILDTQGPTAAGRWLSKQQKKVA